MIHALFITAGVIVSLWVVAMAIYFLWPALKWVLGIGLFVLIVAAAYSYNDWIGMFVLFGGLFAVILVGQRFESPD